MPPKPGANAKKETGRAKKADNETKKAEAAAAAAEQSEAAAWDDGVKGKKAKDLDREAKKAADAARKAENARLLAEEEAAASVVKPKPKPAPSKKKGAPPPAGPGAIAAGVDSTPVIASEDSGSGEPKEEPTEFSATGLDDALDMLSLVNAKTDKASVGQAAAGIEQHPERRFKAAFEAYKQRELPEIKKERPGLRLQQYQELLYKQFQKSPENPFNQQTIAYDATKDEKLETLKKQKEITSERLAVR
ncbi:hypothetical protein FRB95_011398 [Tulasnella sp. JGI-2019a]|nr:hypothetical protein FRB95_011398 [Tulasnella sp. JGI-2019a]